MTIIKVKDKAYYKKKYAEYWKECLIWGQKNLNKDSSIKNKKNDDYVRYLADERFEQTATPEHIVGYYLTFYPKNFYEQWMMEGDIDNKAVEEILSNMCPLKKNYYW